MSGDLRDLRRCFVVFTLYSLNKYKKNTISSLLTSFPRSRLCYTTPVECFLSEKVRLAPLLLLLPALHTCDMFSSNNTLSSHPLMHPTHSEIIHKPGSHRLQDGWKNNKNTLEAQGQGGGLGVWKGARVTGGEGPYVR
jgi:hypothetical protein